MEEIIEIVADILTVLPVGGSGSKKKTKEEKEDE